MLIHNTKDTYAGCRRAMESSSPSRRVPYQGAARASGVVFSATSS
jgi:hypothetical protein